jgi:diguanylate cyclase (GGDEF)-like protein
MRPRPLALPADLHVREACALMRRHAAEEVLVMPSAWSPSEAPVLPIGILTESDALELLTRREPPLEAPLANVMNHPVRTVSAEDDLADTLTLMNELHVHRLPVVSRGKLVGLLTSTSVLEAQASELANLNRHAERLQEEVLHDSLTGLANRRLFEEVLEREHSFRVRDGMPLGLLMVDIDHFKSINDEHGHPVGDEVLRQLAARLSASVRRADLVARVGGEEFAVLATGDGLEQLRHFAEKLRSAVASTPFSVAAVMGQAVGARDSEIRAAARSLRVTISVGGALLASRTESSAALIHRADQALYDAKRAGRNRVQVT